MEVFIHETRVLAGFKLFDGILDDFAHALSALHADGSNHVRRQ